MIRLWPDLVAYIILGIAGFYVLSFVYMSMLFSEWAERLIGVLLVVVPVAAVVWAGWVVAT